LKSPPLGAIRPNLTHTVALECKIGYVTLESYSVMEDILATANTGGHFIRGKKVDVKRYSFQRRQHRNAASAGPLTTRPPKQQQASARQ
jgi:hypothetical protein